MRLIDVHLQAILSCQAFAAEFTNVGINVGLEVRFQTIRTTEVLTADFTLERFLAFSMLGSLMPIDVGFYVAFIAAFFTSELSMSFNVFLIFTCRTLFLRSFHVKNTFFLKSLFHLKYTGTLTLYALMDSSYYLVGYNKLGMIHCTVKPVLSGHSKDLNDK